MYQTYLQKIVYILVQKSLDKLGFQSEYRVNWSESRVITGPVFLSKIHHMNCPAYTLVAAPFQGILISVPDLPVQAFLIEGNPMFQFTSHAVCTVTLAPAVPFYFCRSRH